MSRTTDPEAIERLRKELPAGSTVFTIVRTVSRSGMQRQISLLALIVRDDGKPDVRDWSMLAGQALGLATSERGVKVSGGGMDMGFWLVYELANALHGDGYALHHRWL